MSVGQLYGATEIGSITYSHSDGAHFDPASVGKPMRKVQVRIENLDQPGVEVPIGQEGHVMVHAPSMFEGYVGEQPRGASDFFATGDLGRVDGHGNLTITGRIKLLIDVGGLKVNPIEVEQVLEQHPAIAAAVVVAIPVSETISRVKAIVTSHAGTEVDVDEVRRFARERLSPHKIPRLVEVRASLPRSATGKILRQQVQA